jgi:hypothetical protein
VQTVHRLKGVEVEEEVVPEEIAPTVTEEPKHM